MIRTAKIEDAAEIARIHVETWRSAYAGIMPADFLAGLSLDARRRQWAFALERNALDFFVADEGPRMAGWSFSSLVRQGGEAIVGEILAVYVLAEFQGRGHGAALMAAMVADFKHRGVGTAVLWVLEANQPTRGFYERLQYRPDGGTKEDTFGTTKLTVLRYVKTL